jgi:hydroxymethylglutaryl-CoA synthase
LKPIQQVGIVGYGAYIPRYRIKAAEIARVWGVAGDRFPIDEKAVVGLDEDTITIAVEAAKYALKRARIEPSELGAVYVGTESKPYAVKPSGTVVAEAIGATPNVLTADYEFACKAGTEAFQTCIALASSGMVRYGMAVGVDTAQGRPGDELEYTAACGGAAFIFGLRSENTLALVEGTYSYVTDTSDFWRRDGEFYPCHAGRFTGDPAYFRQIKSAATGLMKELQLQPGDFDYAVFHQPNAKFPSSVAKDLGFSTEKIKPGLLSPVIGNTYAGSSPMGLAATLDSAKPGQRILMVSYGSGAGSDAFSFVVQNCVAEKRDLAPGVWSMVDRKKYIDYALYARHRRKIQA